ncbi:hypothetical protein BN2475_1370011 [Paraburkholderia ribeironis]|uniref:Uncharacterized protein n=1 Tax=Paraburkholderia ribeironis TaxID=1247936 RepID=A0A1N7SPU9_9BURK|nr:hypothetical protein BN2475_1370011 [Paraburkholderia ribeironis]
MRLRHPPFSATLLNFAKFLSLLDLGLKTEKCAASQFTTTRSRLAGSDLAAARRVPQSYGPPNTSPSILKQSKGLGNKNPGQNQ